VSNELNYVEQTSWILFLKYLNDLEEDKITGAALSGKTYHYILDEKYRWNSWASPKAPDGKLDPNAARAGDDLRDFIDVVDGPRFCCQTEKHELSHLYKVKIKNMSITSRPLFATVTPHR
jgi:hypothetical protein